MRVLLRSLAAWVRCATTGARAMSIADQIAGYVSETGYADFDPVAIERAKDLCLSSIGSAVLGARMAVPAILEDYVRSMNGPDRKSVVEGKSESVRVGTGGSRIIEKTNHKTAVYRTDTDQQPTTH